MQWDSLGYLWCSEVLAVRVDFIAQAFFTRLDLPGAAAFDGSHGWFWRNRGKADVTVTLRTDGDYAEIKRVM